MDVEYTGRQTTITKKLKLQAEAGLARIAKIVGNSGSVHVILSTDKYRQIADLTVQTRHQKLVARCEATEMEIALRDALVKIEQQAIRHKKKFGTIKRHPKADVKGAKPEVAVEWDTEGECRGEGGDEEQRRPQGSADAGALLSLALAAGGAACCALDRWGCAAADVAGRGGEGGRVSGSRRFCVSRPRRTGHGAVSQA